jgi:hypothetical protein
MGIVTIIGSARGDGPATRLADAVLAGRDSPRIDLSALRIRDYEYGRAIEGDDFLSVAEVLTRADAVLFVTPVYWYTMSGVLKRFFDRLTDFVTVRKPLGRRLAGRSVWVAACGSDPTFPEGFEVPFRETAAYLDMIYRGALYVRMQDGESPSAEQQRQMNGFGARIFGVDPSLANPPA